MLVLCALQSNKNLVPFTRITILYILYQILKKCWSLLSCVVLYYRCVVRCQPAASGPSSAWLMWPMQPMQTALFATCHVILLISSTCFFQVWYSDLIAVTALSLCFVKLIWFYWLFGCVLRTICILGFACITVLINIWIYVMFIWWY